MSKTKINHLVTTSLFGEPVPLVPMMPLKNPLGGGMKRGNPCVKLYGPGPEGKRCKSCALLSVRQFSKNYYKCDLRGTSSGPSTDHGYNWPVCSKYVPNEDTSLLPVLVIQ